MDSEYQHARSVGNVVGLYKIRYSSGVYGVERGVDPKVTAWWESYAREFRRIRRVFPAAGRLLGVDERFIFACLIFWERLKEATEGR